MPKKALLIVDRNPEIRSLLRAALSQRFSVDVATTIVEATAESRHAKHAGFVIDIGASADDELKFLRGMRASGDHRVVVTISANRSRELPALCYEAGADGHVDKTGALIRELRALLPRLLQPFARRDLIPDRTDTTLVVGDATDSLGAAHIAARLPLPKHLVDVAVVSGMLHDVGKLIMAWKLSEQFGKMLVEAQEARLPVHKVEERDIGFSHAEIGAYLLGLWGLPAGIVSAVARHHRPGVEADDQSTFGPPAAEWAEGGPRKALLARTRSAAPVARCGGRLHRQARALRSRARPRLSRSYRCPRAVCGQPLRRR